MSNCKCDRTGYNIMAWCLRKTKFLGIKQIQKQGATIVGSRSTLHHPDLLIRKLGGACSALAYVVTPLNQASRHGTKGLVGAPIRNTTLGVLVVYFSSARAALSAIEKSIWRYIIGLGRHLESPAFASLAVRSRAANAYSGLTNRVSTERMLAIG